MEVYSGSLWTLEVTTPSADEGRSKGAIASQDNSPDGGNTSDIGRKDDIARVMVLADL